MSDYAIGKRMVEDDLLEQVLDSFPIITRRTITEEWEGEAERIEGSPDYIIGLDGKPFGIELTEIQGVDDAWDYVAEGYRLASKKSKSYRRRGIFRFPIALIMNSTEPALFDICEELDSETYRSTFTRLGFSEVWAIDFSDDYYTPGHPLRRADMFCFKPARWFGFYRIGSHGRKPFG
jgi:hypothetical protein